MFVSMWSVAVALAFIIFVDRFVTGKKFFSEARLK